MQHAIHSLTVTELAVLIQAGQALTLIDVRRGKVRSQDASQIAGSVWRDPEHWLDWKDAVDVSQTTVVYCAKGHEIGQAMTAGLSALGVPVRFLEGGFQAWKATGQALAPL